MEDLELEKKVLRALVEETETLGVSSDKEDETTDSDSHSRRRRTRVVLTSYSEEEQDDVYLTRLSRMEKAMFGDRKFDREPIV